MCNADCVPQRLAYHKGNPFRLMNNVFVWTYIDLRQSAFCKENEAPGAEGMRQQSTDVKHQ